MSPCSRLSSTKASALCYWGQATVQASNVLTDCCDFRRSFVAVLLAVCSANMGLKRVAEFISSAWDETGWEFQKCDPLTSHSKGARGQKKKSSGWCDSCKHGRTCWCCCRGKGRVTIKKQIIKMKLIFTEIYPVVCQSIRHQFLSMTSPPNAVIWVALRIGLPSTSVTNDWFQAKVGLKSSSLKLHYSLHSAGLKKSGQCHHNSHPLV